MSREHIRTPRSSRTRRAATLAALLALAATPALATAADLGVSSGELGAATRPSPPFHLIRVSSADGGGKNNQVGDLDQDDTLTLTFSAPVRPSSVCSSFTGIAQTGYTVTVKDATPEDELRLTAGPNCTPHVATIALGSAGRVSKDRTLDNSSLRLSSGDTVLTITMGKVKDNQTSQITTDTVLTATPDAGLSDISNRAVSLGTASTPPGVQF